jgi:hypothetical protein
MNAISSLNVAEHHARPSVRRVRDAIIEIAARVANEEITRPVLDDALQDFSMTHDLDWHRDRLKLGNAINTGKALLRQPIVPNLPTLPDGSFNPDYDKTKPIERGQTAGQLNHLMRFFYPSSTVNKSAAATKWHRGLATRKPKYKMPDDLNADFAIELINHARGAGVATTDYINRKSFVNILNARSLAARKSAVEAELERLEIDTENFAKLISATRELTYYKSQQATPRPHPARKTAPKKEGI